MTDGGERAEERNAWKAIKRTKVFRDNKKINIQRRLFTFDRGEKKLRKFYVYFNEPEKCILSRFFTHTHVRPPISFIWASFIFFIF